MIGLLGATFTSAWCVLRIHSVSAPVSVRFSIDAITPDVYSRVHGVPTFVFDSVIKNVSDYIRTDRSGTVVGVSFVITPRNAHQVQDAALYFRDLGVDSIRYTFMFDPSGSGGFDEDARATVLRALDHAQELATEDFRVFAVNRLRDYGAANTDFHICGYQHFVWAVGADAKVYPCCIMKYHPQWVFGDLRVETLSEIVNSPRRAAFAYGLDVQTCKPCWLRDENKFIESMVRVPEHVDFV